MSQTVNVVQLIGRAGRDPEMRYTAEGQAVAQFSLATDRRAAKPGTETETDWHRIVCWGKLAEFAHEYLRKGRLVYVSGRLVYRTWTGKDGQQRNGTEIVANDLVLLDRKPTGDGAPATEEAGPDDFPF